MNVKFTQFLSFVILGVVEILFEALKALGLLAHKKHDCPFGEVIYKCNEIARTTYRRCLQRTDNVVVNEFKRSAGFLFAVFRKGDR